MFDWLKRLDPDTSGLAAMMREFGQMLVDCQGAFETASNALLGASRPSVIREGLFETDKRINRAEVNIRRALIVHGTVHGVQDLPTCLVLMSVVKDAERIGDYAKNIYDLAEQVPDWDSGEAFDDLVGIKNRVTALLAATRITFGSQDKDSARRALKEADAIMDHCDARVNEIVQETVVRPRPAATVLAYRYNKRVAAHASNILTSVVMPVDQLDFFDEPRGPSSAGSAPRA